MLRFLWDFYTLNGCADQPNRLDMFRVYRAVRENHRDGTYDLIYWNYNAALEYAIENSVPSLSACEQTGYNGYADWNGVFYGVRPSRPTNRGLAPARHKPARRVVQGHRRKHSRSESAVVGGGVPQRAPRIRLLSPTLGSRLCRLLAQP